MDVCISLIISPRITKLYFIILLSSCFNVDSFVWRKINNLQAARLLILQRMDLYAFAAAPMSAGFRNWLRLAMILSGKAIGQEFGENDAGISCFPLSCATYDQWKR